MRRLVPALFIVAAVAAGTASATSIGDFADVTFSATDVDLEACTASDVDMIPASPTALIDTFTVGHLRLDDLSPECVLDGKTIDVSFVGASLVPGPDVPGPLVAGPLVPGPDVAGPDLVGTLTEFCVIGVLTPGSPSFCDIAGTNDPAPDTYCAYDGVAPVLIPATTCPDIPGPDIAGPDIAGPLVPGPLVPGPDVTVREVLLVLTDLPAGETVDLTGTLASTLDIEDIHDVEIVIYDDGRIVP